ncbi:unnamed protein product [Timema podura]|uniref:DDE Tnp4 domain-containing protein n=1 Tax=Timema podura TaxID=61482 RepID=A0ABN7NHQ3_TIMPD|nr:unnamed protein product [Timema podura]
MSSVGCLMEKLFLHATGFYGVIDCTHITISRPVVNEAAYFNHNQFHYIIVQIVCSYNLQILHIYPTMPGAVDEQFIFRYGSLRQALERLYHDRIRNIWLLGVTPSGKFGDKVCNKGRGETVALHVGMPAACLQLP